MARFRSKVTEICPVGRVVAGVLKGYPLVRVTLETGEFFTISPNENRASCYSVDHSFEVHPFEKGTDMFVLYDEMPPQKVRFFGPPEACERYEKAFA